ncbi:MAG: amino acid ABC transporter permease [Firmicutes bacterium]|nr:amino acid ABC transporter permease [Bacillota bacterium]MBR0105569.1 amino acid ABC transporter permease [Bacillota bacterium]MBR2593910.1 amino acid ABC transporter permease [Bacillota bacterium]
MSYGELLHSCYQVLLTGLALTMKMTAFSLIFAIILGMISCFFSISRFRVLRAISRIYVDVIRGTPLLIQAFFLYFGLTRALNFRMDANTASIIALSLNAGAYLSEIFRGGINAVDKGQMEAARSLGMPYGSAMGKVILPQAIRIVIPSVVNQFIITLKDTSILSAIGMMELTQQGKLIVARNMRSFEIYGTIAIMYLIVITILSRILKIVEKRLNNE